MLIAEYNEYGRIGGIPIQDLDDATMLAAIADYMRGQAAFLAASGVPERAHFQDPSTFYPNGSTAIYQSVVSKWNPKSGKTPPSTLMLIGTILVREGVPNRSFLEWLDHFYQRDGYVDPVIVRPRGRPTTSEYIDGESAEDRKRRLARERQAKFRQSHSSNKAIGDEEMSDPEVASAKENLERGKEWFKNKKIEIKARLRAQEAEEIAAAQGFVDIAEQRLEEARANFKARSAK